MTRSSPSSDTNKTRAVVVTLAIAAVSGLAIFGMLAWRAVTILRIEPVGASNSFEDALTSVRSRSPLVYRDADGRFVRGSVADGGEPPATELHVLAYYADGERLVRADVPLWFFKIKGPAVSYALRGTGFELETLGLTPADLERSGSCVILDERRPTGDRILAWTQ